MEDRIPARPTAYDDALADAVCAAVARGECLLQACDPPQMPTRDTVFAWAESDPEFARRMAAARVTACEAYADDILAIADGFGLAEDEKPKTPAERLQRDRMRIAVRQWLMAKRDPETYGRAAAAPMALDEPAEDPLPGLEAAAWEWAEDDGKLAAFRAHEELVYYAKTALAAGRTGPLQVNSALLGGRPIPLAPFLAADGASLDPEALKRHLNARFRAVYAHRGRPEPADDEIPDPEMLQAAETFLEKHGSRKFTSCSRRERSRAKRKFVQIYADIARAWPDTAPPPI